MAEDNATQLEVSPSSYKFTSIGEVTSLNIETDADEVTFERVNAYGTGTVKFDKESNLLTALTYGSGRYRFKARKEGKSETIKYFDLEVARPILGKPATTELYIDVSSPQYRWKYTPPAGYSIKLLDNTELSTSPVEPTVGTEEIMFIPNSQGTVTYSIVCTKDDPNDLERNVEYVVGYVTIRLFTLSIKPNSTSIFTKLGKTYEIESIKASIGNSSDYVELTFDTEYGEVDKCFTIESNLIPGNDYIVNVVGKLEGEGNIRILYDNDIELGVISVQVLDSKVMTIEPDVEDLTLRYNETYTFTNINFDDNDVPGNVSAIPSSNPPFTSNLNLKDKQNLIYTLDVVNTADRGGKGTLTIKATNSDVGKKTINIVCLKEVKSGATTLYPAVNEITLNVGRTQTYDYVSATEADDIIADVGNPNVCQVRFEELTRPVPKPGVDGEFIEFPPFSKQYIMYIIATGEGETDVTVKGVVNSSDVSSSTVIKVNCLPNDRLPDESSIVNLYSPKLPDDRVGDVIIDLPEESDTLALKEELIANMIVEFGFSYDYQKDKDPDKTTNPVTVSNSSGYPTWLNTKTNELFICLDKTENENIWFGSKGTWINRIVYPNPGEKGFGVGPAPRDLAKTYNLTECDGCWDRSSDNYGNYYDRFYNKFVFIPMHYIIPIADSSLANVYPYDGMNYKFSWDGTGMTTNHIPRCFFNKDKVQAGIFIAKYNNVKPSNGYSEINSGTTTEHEVSGNNSMSTYPVYKTSSTSVKENHVTYTDTVLYPELRAMRSVVVQSSTNVNKLGRHNMTIFIQTMISNLGDLHTIASVEKSSSLDVCYKPKYLVSGTLVREIEAFQATSNETQRYKQMRTFYTGQTKVSNIYTHFSNGTGSIKREYKNLFSHNGQSCGVFDVNGPANTPLPGLLVVQGDINLPNNYKVYALKKSVDITEIEKSTFTAIGQSNTESLILRTPLFNLDNYDLISTINNNIELSNMLYMNTSNPYLTHRGETSLLDGSNAENININAGLNLTTLEEFTTGQYSNTYNSAVDGAWRTSKFKGSSFSMGFLSKVTELQITNKKWYGMFTANYIPTKNESSKVGFKIDGTYNGYRSRCVRFIGSWNYIKQPNSEYMLGSRTCITPNL